MAEPQVNDNALAAPASGFGQTVSFAFDPAGDTPQVRPVQRRAPTVAIQGGLSQGRPAEANAANTAPFDPTATLLMKVGRDILQKKVDEARSMEYVKGMQASMQGQALEEIKKDTPWYATIFGDTPMIEGARAYESQDVVNKTLAQATRDMPALREMSPEQATQHFNSLIVSTQTGDAGRDGLVAKSMLEQMPALMKAQAKASYEWQQDKARSAMGNSIVSGAQGLQELGELYAGDKISEADMKARTTQYLMSVIPPEGINEENYGKTLTAALRQMATAGNFHAVTAIRDSGALAALSPEQSAQVEAAILTQAGRHKDRYASKFVREMATLKSDAFSLPTGQSAGTITERAANMNTAYKKLTGSPVDLYTSDEVANLATAALNDSKRQVQQAVAREQVLADRDATEGQKATAIAEKDAAIESAVRKGEITLLKTLTKATDDEIDAKMLAVLADPEADGSFILNQAFIRGGYTNNVLKQRYLSSMREAEGRGAPTDNWFREVQRFEQMAQSAGGYAYASAYYGDYAPKLARASRMFNGNVLGNPNADRIFTSSMGRDPWDKPQPIDAATRKELISQVASRATGLPVPRWLGGKVPPRAAALATLSDIAEQNVEDWRGAGLADSEAMGVGIQNAIVTGKVELLGGFAIRNAEYRVGGKAPTPLRELMSGDPKGSTYIAVPQGAEDDYFEGFLFEALKVPKEIGSHQLTRTQDAGGTQQFVFSAVDKDGVTRLFRFSALELQTYAGARALKDTRPREAGSLAYGPKITFGTAKDNVSPYASEEYRAAKRAENAAKARPKLQPN